MNEKIKEYLMKIFKNRLYVLIIVFGLMYMILIQRLFVLQIIKGEAFTQDFTYKISRQREVPAARGLIKDKNGVLLATNEVTYSVTIENSSEIKTNEVKNQLIYDVIKIVEENGGTLVNDFMIIMNGEGEFEFATDSENQILRFKKDVFKRIKVSDLLEEEVNMDAKGVYEYLRYGKPKTTKVMFDIFKEEYSNEQALKIMAVRYALWMKRYEIYQPVTIAKNISEKTLAIIEENTPEMPGIQVARESMRVYKDSKYFAHIIGYTGNLSTEELEELKNKDKQYSTNDVIGKSGIEKVMEDYLQGIKGEEDILVDNIGQILEVKQYTDPQAGNDVQLTIDSKLQKSVYKSLEKKLASIMAGKITSNNESTINSKGVSTIGYNELMFALINNNMVNINNFSKEEATQREKAIYHVFKNRQKLTLSYVENNLKTITTKQKKLSKENQEYILYVYKMLQAKGIINKNNVDTTDEEYRKWQKENNSLREFLLRGISKNWINLNTLDIDPKYYTSDEVFHEIVKYVKEVLGSDTQFSKIIYKYLISEKKISGRDLCILLYEQDVLKEDDDKSRLISGNLSAVSFIKKKLNSLKITPAMLALDPCSASCVVTDVKTGEVLALVTYPGYDNNRLSNGVDSEYYSQLLNDKSLPLYNKATQQRTAPGSTYKMVTAAAGLEEEVIGPSTLIQDKGLFDKIALPPKCWKYPSNHGSIDVTKALETSCNYFFYELGFRLSKETSKYDSAEGLENLRKYASLFGFNEKSGVEIIETEPNISNESSVRSAIGQGTNSFTPSQVARYITTIANSGKCYDLSLIDKVTSGTDVNVVIEDFKPELIRELEFKPSTWNAIHSGMRKVVNGSQGTVASYFSGFNIAVAGKSGTAQESKKRSPHSLFVCYAPFDNPEISVTVVLPFANTPAAGVAREVIASYYQIEDKGSPTNKAIQD